MNKSRHREYTFECKILRVHFFKYIVYRKLQESTSQAKAVIQGGIPRGDKVWQIVNDILSNKKVGQ